MPECHAPISDAALIDYWTGDATPAEADTAEAHLFACEACTARLSALAALGSTVTALVRQGRVTGVVSRALVNRMQRDGLSVRLYTVSPGETVPCTIFPGDDLVVTCVRANFAGTDAVSLAFTAPPPWSPVEFKDIPVSSSDGELFAAFPGAVIRQLPSTRIDVTLTTAGPDPTVLGEYVLEHSAARGA